MNKTFNYSINANDIIQSVSDSFVSFANENLESDPNPSENTFLGKSVYEFITGNEVKHLYQLLIEQVRTTSKNVVIPYRCDSFTVKRFRELKFISTLLGITHGICQECYDKANRVLTS